jgi:hypothetical protein
VSVTAPDRSATSSSFGPWPYLPWLLPLVAIGFSRLQVNDLAYQLRAGELMWQSHAVLRTDPFTYTLAGGPWTDQQWGAQLFLRGWFVLGGWRGLLALQAIILSTAYGATYRGAVRAGGGAFVASAITLATFGAALSVPGALAMRPQLLALPLFVVSAWIIRRREDVPWRLALLPLIGVVWVNIHGSFLLLSVLLGVAFVADLLREPRRAWRTGVLLLISCLVPLLNPQGPGVFTYVWQLTHSPIAQDLITEWQPMLTLQPQGIAFAALCAGLVTLVWRRRTRALTLEEVLLAAVFTGLVLSSARNVVWWSLVVPAVACRPLAGWNPGGAWTARTTRVAIGALAALLVLAAIRVTTTSQQDLLSEAPHGVTAWLAEHPDHGRIFATSWGEWFEYALPGTPMFVDARVVVFPDAVWADYLAVVSGSPDWQAILHRWEVDTVVIRAGHYPEFRQGLDASAAWTPVYADADGTVYVRNDGG